MSDPSPATPFRLLALAGGLAALVLFSSSSDAGAASSAGHQRVVLALADADEEERDEREPLDWYDDWAEARGVAARESRLLFLLLYDPDERDHTRYLDRRLEARRVERAMGASFVRVKIDAGSEAGEDLLDSYKSEKLPAVWIFTPDVRPMKAIYGHNFSTRTIVTQIEEALARYADLLEAARNPHGADRDPGGPRPEIEPGAFEHAASCPRACAVCDGARARGLDWLADEQDRDGSWSRPRVHEDRRRTSSLDRIRVALTATAGLALLAGGSTFEAGPHARELRDALEWMREQLREDGLIHEAEVAGLVDEIYSFWQMPLAVWFLAEAYRRLDPDDRRDARTMRAMARELRQAGEAMVRDQSGGGDRAEGGWGYGVNFRSRNPDDEFGWTAVAPTAMVVSALATIRTLPAPPQEDSQAGEGEQGAGGSLAGDVFDAAIEDGIAYLLACQQRDGGVRYRKDASMGSYPEAAAYVLLAMASAGAPSTDTPAFEELARYVRVMHPFHGTAINRYHNSSRLVLGLAMARLAGTPLASGEGRDRNGGARDWHLTFRDLALTLQAEDGSWPDPEDKGGPVWSTATHVLSMSAHLAADRLLIAAPLPRPTAVRAFGDIAMADASGYLDVPDPSCRWRWVELDRGHHPTLRYALDLTVTIQPLPPEDGEQGDARANGTADRDAMAATVRATLAAFQGASDLLFDLTDGGACIRRVTYVPFEDERAERADITFVRSSGNFGTSGRVDGLTHIRRVIENGREVARYGQWIECPLALRRAMGRGGNADREGASTPPAAGASWNTPYGWRVLAHELGHYLFTLPDRYDEGSGRPYSTATIMAGAHLDATELLRAPIDEDDEVVEWELVTDRLGRLRVPQDGARAGVADRPDPGPYAAPPIDWHGLPAE